MTEGPGAPLTKRSLVSNYYITEMSYTSAGMELEDQLPMIWTVSEIETPVRHTLTNKNAGCLAEEYVRVSVIPLGWSVRNRSREYKLTGDVGFVFIYSCMPV